MPTLPSTRLLNLGITGKLYRVINSIYENAKSCVSHNGDISDMFNLSVGLLQGETLSPMLFSMFVNDLENIFIQSNNCQSISIDMLNLFLSMYADDTALISECPNDLQNMLNILYCQNWKLTVNVNKTKVLVFRNSANCRPVEITFEDETLEVVETFCYLELTFKYNDCYSLTRRKLACQGRK